MGEKSQRTMGTMGHGGGRRSAGRRQETDKCVRLYRPNPGGAIHHQWKQPSSSIHPQYYLSTGSYLFIFFLGGGGLFAYLLAYLIQIMRK